MIIVLLGASRSGKSTIENELATHHGFEKIISRFTEDRYCPKRKSCGRVKMGGR